MKLYFSIFLIILVGYGKSQSIPNIDKLDDAVVLIKIYDYNGDYHGHGSGFIIDGKGTVVTNYHVVEGAYSLKILIDKNGIKKTYEVDKIISGDKDKDLAKISIKNPSSYIFPYVSLSKNKPLKGDDCWAIGTPENEQFMNTVSKGLISNIHSSGLSSWPFYILQINAEIGKGSSGGALFNNKGEVVGITSAFQRGDNAARASINYAIWSGELNNLPSINKTTLVNPIAIPCELGFYTNNPYKDNAYLYIDGIYVGSFSKYFADNTVVPICHAQGTISKSLIAGSHSYYVYYSNTGQKYSGTITLKPGECQMFRVGAKYYTSSVETPKSSDSKKPPSSSNNNYFKPREGLNHFSNAFRTNYNLDEDILKNMQFFTSGEIILQRGEKSRDTKDLDKNGNLVISSSANLDNIIISKKSSGVCVKVIDENKIAISFDPLDDSKYLVFGTTNNNGEYYLMGAEWKNGKGKINYGGKVFYIMPGGANAKLDFIFKIDKDINVTSNKVKGRTTNEKSGISKSGLIPFSSIIRTNYNLDFSTLRNMQFFISGDVLLQRGEKDRDAIGLDEHGNLTYMSSANLDNIIISKKSAGVCVKVIDENKIAVSFFESDDQYLVFGKSRNDGWYYLMGADWKSGKGKINFGGKVYYIMPGGAGAYLKIKMKKQTDYNSSTTKNKGRKVIYK